MTSYDAFTVDVSVLPLVSARPAPAVTVQIVGSGGGSGGGACAIAGAEHVTAAHTSAERVKGRRVIEGYLLVSRGEIS